MPAFACRLSTAIPTARFSNQPVCSFAFSIQFTKSFALRSGHVAPAGPAACERQIMNQPGASAHPFEHARTNASHGRIERRPLREPRPDAKAGALGPRAQAAFDLLLPQL